LICAASVAMAAAPWLSPSNFSAVMPPNEWPIRIRLRGSASTMAA
jgi:hypothetical protein